MPEERVMTEKQKQALRLCHHDFEGLTREEAAEKMGITSRAIGFLLEAAEKAAPQLFPILTKSENEIYKLYDENISVEEIAILIQKSPDAVYSTLKRLKEKGMIFGNINTKPEIIQYNKGMDKQIKRKF